MSRWHNFETFLHRKARLSRKEAVRFDFRPYQVRAARVALRHLNRGRNSIIDLPTGAGKTNIAFLCCTKHTIFDHPGTRKILYVVPTRVLGDQVSVAAGWLSPELYRVTITDDLTTNRFALTAAIERANLIVTTPGLFASQLRSGAINTTHFNSLLGFVVVDEFDEFLTIDPTEKHFQVRLERDFHNLVTALGSSPLLLMSGTAPKKAARVVHSFRADLLARFVEQRFHPITVSIPENSYRTHIPIAHVHTVPVKDIFVENCDYALKYAQNKTLTDFECDYDVSLDRDHLMERLDAITIGAIRNVRLADGSYTRVWPEMRRLCRTLLAIVGKYTFLFEDMFLGFRVTKRRVRLVLDCVEQDQFVRVPYLMDRRENGEFWPSLRSKADVLIDIISSHKDEKGVVFTRNVRLSDELAKAFDRRRIPWLELDGRAPRSQRFRQILRFKSDSMVGGVLIITRSTGRRGLDIPLADYAVVYSPKEDEYVMWQELSRIRSTLSRGKKSYIMYYDNTAESEKIARLKHDMMGSANRYVFTHSTSSD